MAGWYGSYGRRLLRQGQVEKSVAFLRRAAWAEPGSPAPHRALGEALVGLGRFREALTPLAEAVRIDPDDCWSHYHMGLALAGAGEKQRARHAFRRARDLNPDFVWSHYQLGLACAEAGHWQEAAEAFACATTLDGEFFWSHYHLGCALAARQRWPEAANSFRRAAALNSEVYWCHYHLGEVEAKQRHWQAAETSFTQAIHIDPGFAWAHHHLADALRAQGRWREAVDAYRRLIALCPRHHWAHIDLVDVLTENADWQGARRAVDAALGLCPEDPVLRFKKKNIDEALDGMSGVAVERPRSATVDVVVTLNEVNEYHGVGVLLKRLFDHPGIHSLRVRNDYDGRHDFGESSACLGRVGFSRADIAASVSSQLAGRRIRHLLCVPYSEAEIHGALAIKERWGVKLCSFLMDDQNIYVGNIADPLMAELLRQSDLILAISPQLRDAYRKKYRRPIWVLPPVVSQAVLARHMPAPDAISMRCQSRSGVLVGNVWNQLWLDKLLQTIEDAGVVVDWYGMPNPYVLSLAGLDEHRYVNIKGFVPEKELIQALTEHPFAVLPTGSGDDDGDRPEVAKLSLPSRLPYIAATSNTPVIVLGSPQTAAAAFVTRFDIGVVCDYCPREFARAVTELCTAASQTRMRRNALALAPLLSAAGAGRWLWRSLAAGRAVDDRFEQFAS